MISDKAILKKIERQPRRTAGYKQLVHELGLQGTERRELSDRLRDLIARGDLVEVDRDRYAIPQSAHGKNVITGRLSMHRDGFGFVIPEDSDLQQRISGDIYISPNAVGSAMHGDRVMVEMGAIRSDGRAEGRILRTLDRAHSTVVGIFHYGSRNNFVRPIDEKLAQDIIIPAGMELPKAETPESTAEKKAGQPAKVQNRVLGEEAKRRTNTWDDLEGVVVDVEITNWPTQSQGPRGRVIEILGHEDDFGVDVEIIIRKFHLPHRFSAEVLEEAQSVENVI